MGTWSARDGATKHKEEEETTNGGTGVPTDSDKLLVLLLVTIEPMLPVVVVGRR